MTKIKRIIKSKIVISANQSIKATVNSRWLAGSPWPAPYFYRYDKNERHLSDSARDLITKDLTEPIRGKGGKP